MAKLIEVEVDLDEHLLEKASKYLGTSDHSEVVRRSLEVLIETAERGTLLPDRN
jgi:Arc/MetJ family transcription regulator